MNDVPKEVIKRVEERFIVSDINIIKISDRDEDKTNSSKRYKMRSFYTLNHITLLQYFVTNRSN